MLDETYNEFENLNMTEENQINEESVKEDQNTTYNFSYDKQKRKLKIISSEDLENPQEIDFSDFLTASNLDESKIHVTKYLSNLFSKFIFENPNSEEQVIAETNEYFDALKFMGDNWIEFYGENNNKQEKSRVVKINHKKANFNETPDYLDEAGHVINSKIKMNIDYEYNDIDGGILKFTYE